jgi:DNA-binding PadR family transcriptional regulator
LIGNELAINQVAKPTIARMIQKLIDEECLTFSSEPRDLRTKRYSLTKKAKDLLQRIIPGYLLRLRVMSAGLTDADKQELISILSRINFLDPRKMIIRTNEESISEKAEEIRKLCNGGAPEDIDKVMSFLDESNTANEDLDFHLGTVGSTRYS